MSRAKPSAYDPNPLPQGERERAAADANSGFNFQNANFRYNFATSRHNAPELCMNLSPPFEGVGNAGCPLHPRSRVHLYW